VPSLTEPRRVRHPTPQAHAVVVCETAADRDDLMAHVIAAHTGGGGNPLVSAEELMQRTTVTMAFGNANMNKATMSVLRAAGIYGQNQTKGDGMWRCDGDAARMAVATFMSHMNVCQRPLTYTVAPLIMMAANDQAATALGFVEAARVIRKAGAGSQLTVSFTCMFRWLLHDLTAEVSVLRHRTTPAVLGVAPQTATSFAPLTATGAQVIAAYTRMQPGDRLTIVADHDELVTYLAAPGVVGQVNAAWRCAHPLTQNEWTPLFRMTAPL
jgi:hypothetical protein